jgi:hypothetical protein
VKRKGCNGQTLGGWGLDSSCIIGGLIAALGLLLFLLFLLLLLLRGFLFNICGFGGFGCFLLVNRRSYSNSCGRLDRSVAQERQRQ